MTENVTGYNWTLEIGAATGDTLPAEGAETWTKVVDIENLKPPSPTRQNQEWFVLDQKSSKKKPGSISFTACTASCTRAYDEEAHDRLENDANGIVAGTNTGAVPRRQFRITASNVAAERRLFAGYCTKFEIGDVANQDRVKYDLELTVDGDVLIIR